MIAATSKIVRNLVLAGEAEVPGIVPPTESGVPGAGVWDPPDPLARQMLLQVAVQDIGQLTDIPRAPDAGTPPLLK